jgi:hypothetical protein
MYRQFDGYPKGHGLELAEFLNSKTIINGFQDQTMATHANGMGCLAAQMVAHFKTEIGGIYLHRVDLNNHEDYDYHVYEDKVQVVYWGKDIFSGSWGEFLEFCKNPPDYSSE